MPPCPPSNPVLAAAVAPSAAASRPGLRVVAAALAAAMLAGCASTSAPVVYQPPSASAKKAARVQSDLNACREQAVKAVGVNGLHAGPVAQTAARAGARDFVSKAVESMVSGSRNVWERARGAGAGEAAGSVVGLLMNWNAPDTVHREYVDLCMKDRGHKVLGWR
jgi:hypothetical protein